MFYRDAGGVVRYHYSVASKADPFDRARGREIAEGRLKKKPIAVPESLDPKTSRVLDSVVAHLRSKDIEGLPPRLIEWVNTPPPPRRRSDTPSTPLKPPFVAMDEVTHEWVFVEALPCWVAGDNG